MIKPIPESKLKEKLYKSSSLVCDRCEIGLSPSADGLSKWRYDADNDQVLCPDCIKNLREQAVDSEIGKIVSFMSGAEWALSEFYDEQKGTQPPPHVKRDIDAKQREMIKKAMEKIRKEFGEESANPIIRDKERQIEEENQ